MRKRVIIYIRLRLSDDPDKLISEAEAWARRRRLVVTEVLMEFSERQKRLSRLISYVRSRRITPDFIISPSIYHFSSLSKFLATLSGLEGSTVGVGFVRENILLHGRSAGTRCLQHVAGHFVRASSEARSRAAKEAHQIRRMFNKRLGGRERLPETIRKEAERHLRNGFTLRAVVKAMDGRISKSSVANLKRGLKKTERG